MPKDGIKVDPKKVTAIEEWPRSETVTEVRSFIGMASYYRRFIKDFAHIAAPLNEVAKETVTKATLDGNSEADFQELKTKLTSAPVLQVYDPSRTIIIETDASQFAIGAALIQPQERSDVLEPLAFFSRKLKPAEQEVCC